MTSSPERVLKLLDGLQSVGTNYILATFSLREQQINKPGSAQVGAISKAQKSKSLLVLKPCPLSITLEANYVTFWGKNRYYTRNEKKLYPNFENVISEL